MEVRQMIVIIILCLCFLFVITVQTIKSSMKNLFKKIEKRVKPLKCNITFKYGYVISK